MAAPPRPFHDLHGLEQTVPPPLPPARVPSPALRSDAHFTPMQTQTQIQTSSRRDASPAARSPPSTSTSSCSSSSSASPGNAAPRYSAWENRGHRSPPHAASEPVFPRERSARSMSPRQQPSTRRAEREAAIVQPSPAPAPAHSRSLSNSYAAASGSPPQRARTPPALEPQAVDAARARTSPRAYYEQRYLAPSDAEACRAREQYYDAHAQRQPPQQQQHQQQQQTMARSASAASAAATATTQAPARSHSAPGHKTGSSGGRSRSTSRSAGSSGSHSRSASTERRGGASTPQPQSSSTTTTQTQKPRFVSHSHQNSAGEANLAMIGAPRQRRAPRAAVPSMCDYLSLDELEGMWAQQDRFVGSISAPQADRLGPSAARHKAKLSLFPKVPVEDLGVHPAFRGQMPAAAAPMGMVQ